MDGQEDGERTEAPRVITGAAAGERPGTAEGCASALSEGNVGGGEPAQVVVGAGRWRRIVSAVAAAAMGAGIFAGGFFLHAVVNWPDLHQEDRPLDAQALAQNVAPEQGFASRAQWGDLLPRLVDAGVIDVEKFKAAAARAGQPLTEEQVRLLTEGSDEPVAIDMQNAKFVLNALWAVGLATENPLVTSGPMARRKGSVDNLASTAGWTLGREAGPSYVGKYRLLPLTRDQQRIVEEVAYGVYRPCCDNPTAFPDCNHGMAALGLAEIMAFQGASADEIFAALKAFNAYWFPDQYLTLAVYYEGQGTSWERVDPRELLDADHSSGSGWKQIDAAVKRTSPFAIPRGGGGGCAA